MKKIVIILALITFFGCKKEEQKKAKVVEQKELVAKMQFKSNSKINITLALNNIVVDKFQSKNISVIEKVSTPNAVEKLKASFGGDNISNNFTINFGNKTTKVIEMQSFNISYGKNEIIIMPKDIKKFFKLNKYVTQDSTNYKLITKKVNGKHNPVITLKKYVIDKLKKQ